MNLAEVKQNDKKLQTESRLSHILKSARLGVWDWNIETGELLWSAECLEMFGLPAGQTMSYEKFLEAIHPEDRARVDQAVKVALEQHAEYGIEMRAIWPDGTVHWVESRGRGYYDKSGKAIRMSGAGMDITRFKETEEELKRARAEAKAQADDLAAVLDAVPAATFLAQDRSCENIVSNRAACELLRVPYGSNTSKSAPEGERPTFVLLENGRELTPEELPVQQAARTGEAVRGKELQIRFADGTSIYEFGHAVPLLDEAGEVRGAVGAFLDITDRKVLEERLRSVTERFQIALRSTPMSVFTQGMDLRYNWIYNPVRRHPFDILGKNDHELLPRPEDAARIVAIKAEMLRSGAGFQGEVVVHIDGEPHTYQLTMEVQRDARGQIIGLIGASYDLTEHRALVADCERLGRQRQLALDAAKMGWWQHNAATGVVSWDSTFREIFGMKGDSGLESELLAIAHPDDVADARAKFLAAMDPLDPKPYSTEYRIVRADGSVRWIEANGKAEFEGDGDARRVVRSSGTVRDITERKRWVESLRHSEERYRTLFESMTEGFALCELVRDENGRAVDVRWLECNPALERLTGLRRETVIGHCASEIFPQEYQWWVRTYENVVKERKVYRFEHGAETVGRVWDLTAFPYEGDRFAVLYDDITPRKMAEHAVRASENRYREQADNLEREARARTRELEQRTLEVVRKSEGLRSLSARLLRIQDEERRRIARELHDSAGQLIAALGMELSKLEQEVKKSAPQLTKWIEESEELVQQLHKEIRTTSYLLHPPLLDEAGLFSALSWYTSGLTQRSGLEVRLEMTEDFGRLPRDIELAVFRLIQESLTNIHRHSGSKTATIRVSRADDSVEVEVRDQGKGMNPDELQKIREGGSGVGIRGMRERLGQFGGELRINSSERGTQVLVTIPVPQGAGLEIDDGYEPERIAI